MYNLSVLFFFPTQDMASLVKVSPSIKTGDDGLEFDLGVMVNLPGEGEIRLDQLIKKLPPNVQLVYNSVMNIKDEVKKMIPQFGTIKDQVRIP